MKHKVLILDDEAIIADDLGFLLEDGGFDVVAKTHSAPEAIEVLGTHAIDIALLDINLGDGESGTDVANEINRHFKIPYLFITSYTDEATLAAVESLNPSAYITKPYRDEEVLMSVRLALKKSYAIKQVFEPVKIMVRDASSLKSINPESLILVKGEDNYTRLVMSDGKEHLISHTLKVIESKLPPSVFCRIHKSTMINMNYIELIEGNSLKVGKHLVSIGKTYREKLFQYLEVL